ncbi:hypothetical protein IWX49DRAFT_625352 [Phyllosticta citricarpa]
MSDAYLVPLALLVACLPAVHGLMGTAAVGVVGVVGVVGGGGVVVFVVGCWLLAVAVKLFDVSCHAMKHVMVLLLALGRLSPPIPVFPAVHCFLPSFLPSFLPFHAPLFSCIQIRPPAISASAPSPDLVRRHLIKLAHWAENNQPPRGLTNG